MKPLSGKPWPPHPGIFLLPLYDAAKFGEKKRYAHKAPDNHNRQRTSHVPAIVGLTRKRNPQAFQRLLVVMLNGHRGSCNGRPA